MTTFYVTTPIYYVNDRPHVGHCYSTVVADAMARFHRLVRGLPESGGAHGDVFFLTGTDEHADKVVTAAASRGLSPQQWSDQNAAEFRAAFESLDCTFDDFIRTTEPRHRDKVPGYIRRLMESGDIYKGTYTGWYDEGQEEYVTEANAKEQEYKSRINGRPLVQRSEPCYFFRLTKYWAPLREYIEKHEAFVQPPARRAEVLGRLRHEEGRDVPISRPVTDDPATQWGIRIPEDEGNRIYVWIDALFNYLTAVDTPERRRFWPASVHLIGKDILWFHAVIWPCLLMALGEKLPATIFGHGWWVSEGRKMSKSDGNFIDLETLAGYAERHSLDALRWYLLTQGPLGGADADFSRAKFIEVYNADLANGLGNCASRVGNMIEKYFGGRVPPHLPLPAEEEHPPGGVNWPAACRVAVESALKHLAGFDVSAALVEAVDLIRKIDGYINETAPFRLAKAIDADPGARERLADILYNCAEALRIASLLFSPALTRKCPALWKTWNCTPPSGVPLADLARFAGPHGLRPGDALAKGEALFMRAEAPKP